MALITIAEGAMQSLDKRGHNKGAHDIAKLLDDIISQQSEELKVIE